MVVGVGDDDGVVAGHDEAVFAVPEVVEATVGGHVTVGVVGEEFGSLGDENRACGGEDDIGGVGAGRVDCGVDFKVLAHGRCRVVGLVATVEERALSEGGPLVDGDGGVGGGFAAKGCITGDGALGVLVEGVSGVGRNERVALLVVVRGRGAVANRVVGVVVVEASHGRIGEGTAGGDHFGAKVVAVGVHDAKK